MASSFRAVATTLSETNDGLYVAIAAWRTDSASGFVDTEPIRFDDRLLWCPFSNRGKVELNYPDSSYGVEVRMIGPDGKAVRRSTLGETFGAKWDMLRSYRDTQLGSIDAQGPYDPRGGGFTGPLLPAPKELFQMEKPGIYILEIKMQMFRHNASPDPEVWGKSLLRFGPVKLKVQKPADQNEKASSPVH